MTDQPKPLTDEELDEALAAASSFDTFTPRLVIEVRRQRAVIRAAADLAVGSDAWCRGCERTLISQGHGEGCPIGALEAEAER